MKTGGRFPIQMTSPIFKSTTHSVINKSHRKKGRVKRHTSVIAIYSVIQILMCLITLIAQYIFVSFTEFTEFIKFTELHAETLSGTLVLRLTFGLSFGISGCLGIWATHKQSVISIGASLIAGSFAACFCLIYLVESAMCVTHMVSEIEKNSVEISVTDNQSLNIHVELGSSFIELELQNKDLKLRLALFTIQLIACFIQAAVVILFCSKLNQTLRRIGQSKYFRPIPSITNGGVLKPALEQNLTESFH